MPIVIPDDATPVDIVGESEFLPGQDWLDKRILIQIAEMMQAGTFPWAKAQLEEPMSIQEGSNGKVINQGHHRYVAAKLCGIEIPVQFEVFRDFWPGIVPFARSWKDVVWENVDWKE